EAHERQPRFGGEVGGQRRRGGHRREQRYAGQYRLLHQLERGPSADQQRAAAERELVVEQRPADDLVDGVVPAHVLAYREQRPGSVEQPRGVQPASGGEHLLRVPQPVRQRRKQRRREKRPVRRQRRDRQHADVLDGGL